MTETVAPTTDNTIDVPECICDDSNLPAKRDCPHCYPARGERTSVPAGELTAGQIIEWAHDTGLALVRHVELSEDRSNAVIVVAGAGTNRFRADYGIVVVPHSQYEAALAKLRDHRARARTVTALRELANRFERGLPLPVHGLSIAGTYRSAHEVSDAAERLGCGMRREATGPVAACSFDVDEYDPAVFIRFNHFAPAEPAPKAASAVATSGVPAAPSGSASGAARTDEPAVDVPDPVETVRAAVAADEARTSAQLAADAQCEGCADVRIARGWRDDATGLTSGPVVDEFRPHTCGREV